LPSARPAALSYCEPGLHLPAPFASHAPALVGRLAAQRLLLSPSTRVRSQKTLDVEDRAPYLVRIEEARVRAHPAARRPRPRPRRGARMTCAPPPRARRRL